MLKYKKKWDRMVRKNKTKVEIRVNLDEQQSVGVKGKAVPVLN
jgi:hypothetical protein